jgi:hypothetical protein
MPIIMPPKRLVLFTNFTCDDDEASVVQRIFACGKCYQAIPVSRRFACIKQRQSLTRAHIRVKNSLVLSVYEFGEAKARFAAGGRSEYREYFKLSGVIQCIELNYRMFAQILFIAIQEKPREHRAILHVVSVYDGVVAYAGIAVALKERKTVIVFLFIKVMG